MEARTGWVRRGAYGLLLGVLGYGAVELAAGAEPAARIVLLRFGTLAAAAVYAVAAPHALLPDARVAMLQRLNRRPRALLLRQLRAWCRVVLPGAAGLLLLAFVDAGDPARDLGVKALQGAAHLLVTLGVGVYSLAHYGSIGPVSQAWQEGTRGRAWRYLMAHATIPVGVPPGLVPALTATARVFAVGILGVVATAYAGVAGPAWVWVPGAALLGGAAAYLVRLAPGYDRAFYATNAFYAEVFGRTGGVHAEARAAIPYGAVYWAPRRWKPAVWAALRQLDRRLPLGRFVALGHALLWLLFFQDASAATVGVYLLLFAAAKNGAVGILATPALAPPVFQQMLLPPGAWVATRFLVNLRWTLPLLGSLLLVAGFDPAWTVGQALLWTGFDVVAALAAAFLVTYGAEFQHPRRFA